MKKNFVLDIASKILTINSAFAKAVEMGEGADYQTYLRLMNDIPGLTVIHKTHKTPAKYHTKSGEIFNCNQFKNLTYDRMERFILGLPNNTELLTAFYFLRDFASKPLTSSYVVVREWFVKQFPEFRKNPLFYLYNDVKVIDIAPFVQKQREREEVAEAKEA